MAGLDQALSGLASGQLQAIVAAAQSKLQAVPTTSSTSASAAIDVAVHDTKILLPPEASKVALRWAVFEDHGEIRFMPGIRVKSSTKKTDHVQVQEIEQGGRAKSHETVKVDKKTASFTSKRKAEDAAAALRTDLVARQPETASAENRAMAPALEAQGASALDTTTGEPEAQAAAPDTSAVAPADVTHDDGDEIVQVGSGAGVQGVEGVESAEGVAGARDVMVKLEPEDNLGDIKMKVVPENNLAAQDSAAAEGSAVLADSAETQDTQVLWQSVADQDAAEVRR